MEDKSQQMGDTIAVMRTNIDYIKRDIGEIKDSIKNMGNVFVSRAEFLEVTTIQKDHETRTRDLEDTIQDYPLVKKIVFGAVTVILLAVLSAMVYLVVSH